MLTGKPVMGPVTSILPLRKLHTGVLILLALLLPASAPADVHASDSSVVRDTTSRAPQQGTAWTSYSISRDDLLAYPSQELSDYLELIPGVTKVDGQIHFRGARQDAVFYGLDGFGITNPVTNSPILSLIPEAVSRIDVHTGAYGAAYGRSTGGLVLSSMRQGGDTFGFTASARTDELARPGEQVLGTTVQGYRRLALTASGPVVSGIRFFVAGEHRFAHNRQPMFLEPFRFDSLRVDRNSSYYDSSLPDDQQVLLPGPVEFRRNYVPSNFQESNTAQGNISIDIEGATMLFLASVNSTETAQGGWPWVRENYYRQNRRMTEQSSTTFIGVRLTQQRHQRFRYSISYGYSRQKRILVDPHFGEEWKLYSDSLLNALAGFTGFRYRYSGFPPSYATLGGLVFAHPFAPNASYEKFDELSHQVSFAGEAFPIDLWTVRFGAAYETWTLRKYSLQRVDYLMQYGIGRDQVYRNEADRHAQMIRLGGIRTYGFDPDGGNVDTGPYSPYKPDATSAYVDNEFHEEACRLNFGFQYERYHPRLRYYPDENNVPYVWSIDLPNDTVALITTPHEEVLPRISASFAATASLLLHFSFGRYAQFPELKDLLTTSLDRDYSRNLRFQAKGGQVPSGEVRPERSSQMEVGVDWRNTGGTWAVSGTAFRKVLPNQLALAEFDSARDGSVFVFRNEGESSILGMEMLCSLRPSDRFSASIRYTYAGMKGTQTYPKSNWAILYLDQVYRPDAFYEPDYARSHTIHVIADLHFLPEDGPFLEGLRIVPVLSMLSGRRYTREHEFWWLGSTNPWRMGVRTLDDPRLSEPVEPTNSSTTPWILNCDLHVSKLFAIGPVRASLTVDILNLLDSKQAENVYPVTGKSEDDGWLNNSMSRYFTYPGYREGYQILNNQNREHYFKATGVDIYRPPRQFRVGVRVEM